MINYGFFFEKKNFRGRNEILKTKIRLGYREQYGLLYRKPFFKHNENNGISYFFTYNRQHESSYQTENNYLAYTRSDQYIRKNYQSELSFLHRFNFYHYMSFTFGFASRKANDSLISLNPDFYGNNKLKISYLTAKINYYIDKRDIHYYPIKGYYIGITVKKYGLGIFNELNKYALLLEGKKYWQFLPRWTSATSVVLRKSSKKLPYFLNYGLGYGTYLNGFEYFVIQGSDVVVSKNMLRFNLIAQKISHLSFIPFKKFNKIHYAAYINTFFHAGYVRNYYPKIENNNTMENTLLYSYGIGLDIVTYYDKILRIDFSMNNFNHKGIYLHMSAPI